MRRKQMKCTRPHTGHQQFPASLPQCWPACCSSGGKLPGQLCVAAAGLTGLEHQQDLEKFSGLLNMQLTALSRTGELEEKKLKESRASSERQSEGAGVLTTWSEEVSLWPTAAQNWMLHLGVKNGEFWETEYDSENDSIRGTQQKWKMEEQAATDLQATEDYWCLILFTLKSD